HHQAGRYVGEAHRRVGGVHRLPARALGPEHVDPHVGGVDLDLDLVGFGEDRHRGGGGVDASLRLGLGHALDTVDTRLVLEPGVGPSPFDCDRHPREPSRLRRHRLHGLDLEPVGLGVALVHAQQIPGPDGRLVSPGGGADLDDHVLVVVGVLGDHRPPDLSFEALHLLGALFGEPLQLGGHGRVLGGELEGLPPVLIGAPPLPEQADDDAELGMALAQLGQTRRVGGDFGPRQLRFDLPERLLYLGEAGRQLLFHQPAIAPWRATRAESGTAPRTSTAWSWSSSRAVTIEEIATSLGSAEGRLVVSFWSHSPGAASALDSHATRPRPEKRSNSWARPAITGIPRIRVATSHSHPGWWTSEKTSTEPRITMSRKLVPRRGCSGSYLATASSVSGSPAS